MISARPRLENSFLDMPSVGNSVPDGRRFIGNCFGETTRDCKEAKFQLRFGEYSEKSRRFDEGPDIVAAQKMQVKNYLQALQQVHYELGDIGFTVGSAGNLYPVYIRGAHLQKGGGKEAQAEFLKFLDHRTITFNSPLGP